MASSLEFNKLLAGVLTAGIIASLSGIIAGMLYRPQPLQQHAFSVAVPEGTDAADGDAADDTPSLAVLLAAADPAAGETLTRQCAACHVFDAGGPNRVGPALHGVLGRDIGTASGFNYSPALTGLEGDWDYEKLNQFLANPRGYAPGTSMSYAGMRSPEDRANLIAYLRTLSDNPPPLPEVEEEAPAEEAPDAAEPETDDTTALPVENDRAALEAPAAIIAYLHGRSGAPRIIE